MWSYVKNILLGYIYLVFMGMIAWGISYVGSTAAEFAVCLVNVGFYCFVMWYNLYKEGEDAMNTRYSNDLEREYMVRTGFIRKLKTHEEYKSWKGFLMGGYVCLPLVLLMILHLILGTTLGPQYNGGGVAAGVMYLGFYWLYAVFMVSGSGTVTAMSWGGYFILLYAVIIILATFGIAYIVGGRKAVRQREMIKDRHKQIYGE